MKRIIISVLISVITLLCFIQPKPVLATSTTFYSSTSDGLVRASNGTYATAWAAATGTVDAAITQPIVGQYLALGTYTVFRGYLFFDTSSIPVGATLISASLSLYGTSIIWASAFDVVVTNGQPTYPHDPLVVGDYAKGNYTGNGGSLTIANVGSWSASGYNLINLNATGIGWINTTGTTKLCLRTSDDIAGTSGLNEIAYYASEQGMGYQPKLVVTYATTPTIQTATPTNISTVTARLQSYIPDNGGISSSVRFGWGQVNAGNNITAYANHNTYSGTYNTFDAPYLDITGLSSATTYYFNVEINNGSYTATGTVMSFLTESSVGSPTNGVALPGATSIVLSWSKGAGSTTTVIRMKANGCPTDNTDGTLVYNGAASTYTVSGLTPGVPYCFWIAGYSAGVGYSLNNLSLSATTTLSGSTGSIPTPTVGTDIASDPTVTTISANNPLGKIMELNTTAINMPLVTGWVIFVEVIIAGSAFVAYKTTSHDMAAYLVILVLNIFAGVGSFVPPIMAIICGLVGLVLVILKMRGTI